MYLVRNGQVLCSVEVASTRKQRARGLLGRTGFDGAMLFYRTSSVHTIGMRFAIDVAFCRKTAPGTLVVDSTTTMKPWRLGLPRFASSAVLEAEAGTFARWEIVPGDGLLLMPLRTD